MRAGRYKEVQVELDDKGWEILSTEHTFGLSLDRLVELTHEDDIDPETQDEAGAILLDIDNAEMTVTAFHLAVMSNQRKVVRVMLQHVANIGEEEECSNALVQVLGTKTSVVFTGGEAITYDKDDRSLDGMNAFHLASKYDPKAIEVIFDILSTSHVTYSEVLELLEEKDKHSYW